MTRAAWSFKTSHLHRWAETYDSEISSDFINGMVSRMCVSFYKYGPVAQGYPDKLDAMKSLQLRLDMYIETGNVEYLIDAANFAMIEFMHPRHPDAHFRPTDSSGSPGRVALNEIYDKPTRLSNSDLADADEKLL